ncbi:MAG: transporter substrate-binding domain-containing protein, partial [Clostridia bacterium]|nr:transporter substrate-binding domain-containing protein [Clostridia bacterium]
MKKLLTITLALVMAASLFVGCGADKAPTEKLLIGYTIYEPMNYMDADGKLTGFDTEFAEAVCEKLGVAPEFVEINWDTK